MGTGVAGVVGAAEGDGMAAGLALAEGTAAGRAGAVATGAGRMLSGWVADMAAVGMLTNIAAKMLLEISFAIALYLIAGIT